MSKRTKDITGKRFGKLTAIRKSDKRLYNKYIAWECLCDCGNITYASVSQLNSGHKTSCGCNSNRNVNLSGNRYGRLLVIRKIKDIKAKDGHSLYKCSCDCGNEKIICGRDLTSGHTKSCGCYKSEINREYRLKKYLKDGTYISRIEGIYIGRVKPKSNTGIIGVHKLKNVTFIANITFKGKCIYLGSFNELNEAIKVRKEAEEKYFGSYLKNNL